MFALTAYMDESGHSSDPRLHYAGMAGFVAPAEAWAEFERMWQTVLDRFGLVKGFHMKLFAHSQGEYKGWDKSKRQDLYGALVGVITTIKPFPTGAVVSVADFGTLSEIQRAGFRDPYYMAFQQCTRGACLSAYGLDGEKVAMVYAYQEEFGAIKPKEVFSVDQAGGAEKLWHAMKEMTPYGKWMGSYSSSTPEDLIPLQAADLLAYELVKEYENLLTRPNDKMRWGLRQVIPLAGDLQLFSFIDRAEMLRFVKESRMPCQQGVEEIANVTLQMIFARRRILNWIGGRVETN